MSEEWSDWILHDGRGCPVKGRVVEAVVLRWRIMCGTQTILFSEYEDPPKIFVAGYEGGQSWDWSNWPEFAKVIRYRIRRPRGMTIREGLLENLPATVEGVGA